MAHRLSINKQGQAEMFVAGAPAWHGLGKNVQDAVSWSEAVKLAQLNWKVEKFQLEYSGAPVEAWGMFRGDTKAFLGAVGKQYTPIQNDEMLSFMDVLAEGNNGAHFESAGAIDGGAKIWGLMKLPSTIKVGEDISETYLLGYNRHDGRECNKYKLTSVRVVCNNTLTSALSIQSTAPELKIRHSKGAETKMAEAKKLFTGINREVETLSDKFNWLASRKMTSQTMQDVLRRLFPEIEKSTRQQNVARDILVNFENNDGNVFPEQRGTAFNFLNAVTRFIDHGAPSVKVGDVMEAGAKYEIPDELLNSAKGKEIVQVAARRQSALFGRGDDFKSEALDTILSAVKYAPSPSSQTTGGVDGILSMVAS